MQINRMFEIIYILLEKGCVTAKELAQRFEVSTRTIYRDIDNLSESGIPVFMNKGKGGGISLLPGFVLDKTVITDSERKQILSSLYALQSVEFDDANAALQRLSHLFGVEDTDWIQVDFGYWSDGKKEAEIFQTIKAAILEKKEVSFNYTSSKGEEILRIVEPLKLIFKGVSWYVYGYCKIREDYRFFKLKRIHDLKAHEKRFIRKCPSNINIYSENKENIRTIKVKLRIASNVAYRVCDDFENYTRLSDGSYIVEGLFPDNDWFLYQVISYGDDCEVLEPLDLKIQIKDKLLAILKKY